jgi:adenylate cyclase
MGDANRRFNPNLTKVMAAPSKSNTPQVDTRDEALPLVDSDPSRLAANGLWNTPAPKHDRRGLAAADVASLVGAGFQNWGFRWLLEEGRRITALVDFVAALSREPSTGGLPLQRVYVAQRTLHPQVAALGYLWNRGDAVAQMIERDYAITASAAYLMSPMRRIYENGEKLIRRRLVGPEAQIDFPVLQELRDTGATDYAIFALELDGEPRASLSITTDAPQGFSDAQVAGMEALMPLIAMVVEAREWHRLAESLLEVYLGADAGRQVLSGRIRRGEGTTLAAAIWFCDLRDFTVLSNQLPRDEVIALLNDYFDAMARPVHARGGEILKFVGDAMLAIFPMRDDLDRDSKCHVALQAAYEAFDALDGLNEIRASAGKPPIRAGIGLHAGSVSYGNIGAAIGNSARLDFTAIGPAVNLASRIQDMCKVLDRPLLASKAFASPCGSMLVPLGHYELKGFPEPQQIYGLPE